MTDPPVAARSHGLSIRAPFYDRQALAFMFAQPNLSPNKRVLREYAASLMPRDMAYSPKLPQSAPLDVWLRGPLKDWAMDSLAPERLNRQGLFDGARVRQAMTAYYAGGEVPGPVFWTLWNILAVAAWQDRIQSIANAADA